VRRLRRLVQKRSLRWSEGVCVIEGPDLVESALESGAPFEAIYVDADEASSPALVALTTRANELGVRIFALENGVLAKVADAQTPQPVLAAVRFASKDVNSIDGRGLILVVHDLKDPGNAGTIIRSADAAGASAVIFTGQSVDPYNPKTLRATAGSIFHLDVCVATLDATLAHFSSVGAQTLATIVRGGASHRHVNFAMATVVVIGNESEGLSEDVIAKCDRAISIPMAGRSESLNAGVAASLIAFEALWQRDYANSPPPTPSL
jgi:RNA methyltransferase, TrmH family